MYVEGSKRDGSERGRKLVEESLTGVLSRIVSVVFERLGSCSFTTPIVPPNLRQFVIQVQLYSQPPLLLSPNSNEIVTRDAALFYSACIGAPGGIEVVPAFRSRDDNRSGIIRH